MAISLSIVSTAPISREIYIHGVFCSIRLFMRLRTKVDLPEPVDAAMVVIAPGYAPLNISSSRFRSP